VTEKLVLSLPLPFIATPFEFEFSGAQGENRAVWVPDNAVFEFAGIIVRSFTAMDMNVCDSHPGIPICFVQTLAGVYTSQFLGIGRVRSTNHVNPRLILMDPVGVQTLVKGMVYGYEFTRDGYYR
jgi:hypothetical protein